MAVKAIYVPLSPAEIDGLRTIGQREDRDIRRQAARYVREGLERAGALMDPHREPDPKTAA